MIKKELFTLCAYLNKNIVYQNILFKQHDYYQCEVCKENRKIIPEKLQKTQEYNWRRHAEEQLIWYVDIYSPLYCKSVCNRTMHSGAWWNYELWQRETNPEHDYKSTFVDKPFGMEMRHFMIEFYAQNHLRLGDRDFGQGFQFPVFNYTSPMPNDRNYVVDNEEDNND